MPFCSIIFTNFMKSTKIFCFWLKNRCRVSQKQHLEILQKIRQIHVLWSPGHVELTNLTGIKVTLKKNCVGFLQ